MKHPQDQQNKGTFGTTKCWWDVYVATGTVKLWVGMQISVMILKNILTFNIILEHLKLHYTAIPKYFFPKDIWVYVYQLTHTKVFL